MSSGLFHFFWRKMSRREVDGLFADDEIVERLALRLGQHILAHAARRQREDLVEEDFLHACAVLRQLVLEFAAIF